MKKSGKGKKISSHPDDFLSSHGLHVTMYKYLYYVGLRTILQAWDHNSQVLYSTPYMYRCTRYTIYCMHTGLTDTCAWMRGRDIAMMNVKRPSLKGNCTSTYNSPLSHHSICLFPLADLTVLTMMETCPGHTCCVCFVEAIDKRLWLPGVDLGLRYSSATKERCTPSTLVPQRTKEDQ